MEKFLTLNTCKSLLIQAAEIVRKRFLLWIFLGLVMLAGAVILYPHDASISARCVKARHGITEKIAKQLSFWGDYRTGTLILFVTIWFASLISKRKEWRVAALAVLFAATLAGVEVYAPRLLLGRARPNSGLQDGFYGPSLQYKYNSFPSGHATTSSATAAALVVALPPVGVPVLIGAAGVIWSRMCLGVHYTTDVWVGGWIGLLNGIVLGLAARRLRAKAGGKPAT